MRTFILTSLFTLISSVALAIPPVPPTPIIGSEIVCKSLETLSDEETKNLDEKPEKIISYDQITKEICFKK